MVRALVTLIFVIVQSYSSVTADPIDPESLSGSFNAYMKIREKLPMMVRNQLWITDDAEENVLSRCATMAHVPQILFTAYTMAREAEREIIKTLARQAGPEKAAEIVDVHKALRKETPWNFMKLRKKFRNCFDRQSSGLKDYLAVRKKETEKDGGIDNVKEEAVAAALSKAGKASKGPPASSVAEAEPAQQDAEDEAFVEEMKRLARSRDVKDVFGDKDGVIDGVNGTADDVNGTVKINASIDNVTSADVTKTETTTKTNVGDDSILLKFAMVFGMIIHLVIVSLIVVSQGDRISEWFKGRENKEDIFARRETEPLNFGKQNSATGTTLSESKTGFNPA